MKIVIPIYYTMRKRNKKTNKVEDKDFLVWMNLYRNLHFQVSNKMKEHYHEIIKHQINWEKFNRIKPYYKLYIKNKLTDWWNVVAIMEKFLLDALVENQVIKNDTYDIVTWHLWADYFFEKENPRCEIYIEEII